MTYSFLVKHVLVKQSDICYLVLVGSIDNNNTTNQDKVADVALLYKDMFDQEAVGHYTTSPMEFI